MRRVLITGGNGFIGKDLKKRLSEENINFSEFCGRVEDPGAWCDLEVCSHVIHLASKNYVPQSWENPTDFMATNVLGMQNTLEYCRKYQSKLIYISAYLYGIPEFLPITEDHPLKPNNPYALSKELAEKLCEFYSKNFKLDITVLRLFNVYGGGQRSEFLIPNIVNQILSSKEIKINDLHPKRDYVHINDVIQSIILALNAKTGYHIYNVGSGESISVSEIIDVLQNVFKSKLPVVSRGVQRMNEIPDVVADISKIRSELGWLPFINFESGAKELKRLLGCE